MFYYQKPKIEKTMLFIIATQHKKQSDKKLLGSIIKIEDDDELRLGEVIKNTKKSGKVIKELRKNY